MDCKIFPIFRSISGSRFFINTHLFFFFFGKFEFVRLESRKIVLKSRVISVARRLSMRTPRASLVVGCKGPSVFGVAPAETRGPAEPSSPLPRRATGHAQIFYLWCSSSSQKRRRGEHRDKRAEGPGLPLSITRLKSFSRGIGRTSRVNVFSSGSSMQTPLVPTFSH